MLDWLLQLGWSFRFIGLCFLLEKESFAKKLLLLLVSSGGSDVTMLWNFEDKLIISSFWVDIFLKLSISLWCAWGKTELILMLLARYRFCWLKVSCIVVVFNIGFFSVIPLLLRCVCVRTYSLLAFSIIFLSSIRWSSNSADSLLISPPTPLNSLKLSMRLFHPANVCTGQPEISALCWTEDCSL